MRRASWNGKLWIWPSQQLWTATHVDGQGNLEMTSLFELSVGPRMYRAQAARHCRSGPGIKTLGKTGGISISDVGPGCEAIACHVVGIDVACAGVDGRAVLVSSGHF